MLLFLLAVVGTGPITTGSQLQFQGTNLCIQATAFNVEVDLVVASCDSTTTFQQVVSGTGSCVRCIQMAVSSGGWCFNVARGDTTPGAKVILYWCDGGANSQWTRNSQGRWSPDHAPNMCLDASNTTIGANVVINPCNTTVASQQIQILPLGAIRWVLVTEGMHGFH